MTSQPDAYPEWEIPPENRNTQWDDLRIEHEVEREEAGQPAYPGYATPTFRKFRDHWVVTASEGTLQSRFVGAVTEHPSGWTAVPHKGAYVGLFPTQQAAGEALVRHAGYEVLG